MVEDIKKFLDEAMTKVEEIIKTETEDDSTKKDSIDKIETKIADLLDSPSAEKLEEVKGIVENL